MDGSDAHGSAHRAPGGRRVPHGHEVYRFDVVLRDGEWQLCLPGSRGEQFRPHELTDEEATEILPRTVAHLRQDRLFGIPIGTYAVRVCRRSAP